MNRWAIIVLFLSAAAGATWLVVRGPSRNIDDTPAAGLGEAIQLPEALLSGVGRLRRKTVAGTDRFSVEQLDEEIAPHLEDLKRVLLAPRAAENAAIWERLGRDAPRWGDFEPREEVGPSGELGRGVYAKRSRHDPDGQQGRDPERPMTGPEAVRDLIQPLDRLSSVELKVTEIRRDPDENTMVSTVLFQFAGADTRDSAGRRHQWSGRAEILWDTRSWKVERWTTLEMSRAEFDGAPFRDVTASALGGHRYYDEILSKGLDHFRERLDAASGIDVYGHHGVAIGDANGDGLDDLYLPMMPTVPNLLLLGRGDGTFEDSSHGSGTDVLDGTSHALFLDVENDGDQDLVMVTDGGLLLLVNGGLGEFTATDAFPDIREARSTPLSLAAADYDLDGLVDLYVASYVFWRGSSGDVDSRFPYPYHDARNGAPNFLLRNRGGGRFEDVTAATKLDIGNSRFSFAAAWGDYDGDGDPDLYVANDFGSNNLYRNQGDGTFTDVARAAGVVDIGPGMSAAWEDYDGDGDLDLYVGNMFSAAGRRVTGTDDYKESDAELQGLYRRHARGNSLFQNRGDGTFEDVSIASGAYFGRWAWASGFVDFNLDGLEDIYIQNGFVTSTRTHDL
ncbi:MAG: VCBS repeat-containing protein [Actinobacteria bacterium]|nr:VCBS repeat-containing protein [Actinomycetota bacterium]